MSQSGRYQLGTSPSGPVETVSGNTGTATPVGGNINIIFDTSEGTARTTGAGDTLTLTFTDGPSGITQQNTGIGLNTLQNLAGGASNSAFGVDALEALTTGNNNVAIGVVALTSNLSASGNVAVGVAALEDLTSGSGSNTALGFSALDNVVSGTENIAIGSGAATSYTTTESSNIIIGHVGVITDNNTIRIGTDGSGVGQQDTTFIAGIHGVTPAGATQTVIIDASGQLGSTPSPAAGFTWNEVLGVSQAMAVNNGYVTNNVGLVTVTLPAVAAFGDIVAVVGKGAGGWLIAQNAGQTIHFIGSDTTPGAGGSLASTVRYDCVELICITANTDWVARQSMGNITVV